MRHRAKSATVILGFCFGSIGAIWSYWFEGSLGGERDKLTRAVDDGRADVQYLASASSDYFIANGQSDLIFMLSKSAVARADIAPLIYGGNLYDRATPIRNMIGALAIAKLLDYRQTYDAYEAMNTLAREGADLASFMRLKTEEQRIVELAADRIAALEQQRIAQQQRLREIDKQASRQSMVGVFCSLIGSMVLMLANMMSMRRVGQGLFFSRAKRVPT